MKLTGAEITDLLEDAPGDLALELCSKVIGGRIMKLTKFEMDRAASRSKPVKQLREALNLIDEAIRAVEEKAGESSAERLGRALSHEYLLKT